LAQRRNFLKKVFPQKETPFKKKVKTRNLKGKKVSLPSQKAHKGKE